MSLVLIKNLSVINLKFTLKVLVFAFLIFTKQGHTTNKNNLHKLCLEAKDYAGCMKANSNPKNNYKFEKNSFGDNNLKTNQDEKEEKCWGPSDNYWCIAKEGVDFLGMPKLVGWNYVEDKIDLTVSYFERVARKVKVRGDYGRYIEVRNIRRVLVSPSAGTSSSVFGSGEANCYDTGYGSISCSYTPPTVIPGIPSSPGGVGQIFRRFIIDCEDETYQRIVKGDLPTSYGRIRKKSKWISLSSEKAYWFPKDRAKGFCDKIDSLNKSDFTKYQ